MSSSSPPSSSELILAARVVGGHGIHGVLKIHCFLDNPHNFKKYLPIVDASGKIYDFEILSITPKHILGRLPGIETRTQADGLKGLQLYIQRQSLNPLPQDEYYHHDLIGCQVLSYNGELLGKLIAISNYGAQDILEIVLLDGKNLLLPFQKEFVSEVTPHLLMPSEGYIRLTADYSLDPSPLTPSAT